MTSGPSIVALGGGHGLAASLGALRQVCDDLTAVVTVADDGGSSGRLREEFGALPPGDLRMALAALCGDDDWGQTWGRVLQHRFASSGELDGHSLGNLLLLGLADVLGDEVAALEWVAHLVGAPGRVVPMSRVPLEICADVEHSDGRVEQICGQHRVASTMATVRRVWLAPEAPSACRQAVAAVGKCDWVVLGPGSWFTSVIPHLMVPDLRAAIQNKQSNLVVTLNLDPHKGETRGRCIRDLLRLLESYAPGLQPAVALVDPSALPPAISAEELQSAINCRLVVADVASATPGVHDPDKLATAYAEIVGYI